LLEKFLTEFDSELSDESQPVYFHHLKKEICSPMFEVAVQPVGSSPLSSAQPFPHQQGDG